MNDTNIMDGFQSGESRTGSAVKNPAADLLAVWSRIVNLGSLYPPDHIYFKEVAQAFQENLARIRGSEDAVVLGVAGDGLVIQAEVVGLDVPGARPLHSLLHRLGILRVVLDQDVSLQDIHDFVTRLSRNKHQQGLDFKFRELEFRDFPESIRIEQRQFGKRVGTTELSAQATGLAREAARTVLRSTAEQVPDEEKRTDCETVIENAFTRMVERMELNMLEYHTADAGNSRSLDVVLQLGVSAIQHAITSLLESGKEITDLSTLFEHAEKALALSDDAESVKVMVDVLREAAKDAQEENSAEGTDTGDAGKVRYALTIDELKQRIAESATLQDPLGILASENRSEILSILSQLLIERPMPRVLAGLRDHLEKELTGVIDDREWEVLHTAGRSLLECGDASVIDYCFPPLLAALRQSNRKSIAKFLAEITKTLTAGDRALTWPHLANEVLLGLGGEQDPRSLQALYDLVSSLPEDQSSKAIRRLENLSAVHEGSLDKKIFQSRIPELLSLCARLLHTSLELVAGSLILKGFQSRPPAWLDPEALQLFKDYRPQYREFLVLMLEENRSAHPSQALKTAVARKISHALASWPEEKRTDSRVPGAVRSLGILNSRDAEPILKRILKERRFLFLRAWPKACRAAARKALLEMRASKKSGGA